MYEMKKIQDAQNTTEQEVWSLYRLIEDKIVVWFQGE